MLHREYGSTSFPTYITCPGSTSCISSRRLALPRIDRLRVASNVRHLRLSRVKNCIWKSEDRFPYLRQQYLWITRLDEDEESFAGLFSTVNSDADTNRARCRRTVKLFALCYRERADIFNEIPIRGSSVCVHSIAQKKGKNYHGG